MTRLPFVFLCAMAALCCLTGCSRPLQTIPPAGLVAADRLLVFADGLHSGLVLSKSPSLATLDAQPEGPPVTLPFMEVGFAADEWIANESPGSGMKLRMAFGTSGGVLDLCHRAEMSRPARSPDIALRTWTLEVSAEGRQALDTFILAWRNASAPQMLRPPLRPTTFRFSTHRWSIFHNCHDFSVLALRAAGLDLTIKNLYTNDVFISQMDEALATLAASGITVIGPAP
jgi:hypothetical protein